jgi:hypothetical protein
MAGYGIKIKFSHPLIGDTIIKGMLPRVHEAVGAISEAAKQKWESDVMHAPGIWSSERQAYVSSIKWEYTGDLQARVWSTYDIANQIETGRPARDLKRMLLTSNKVRISHSKKHNGQRYLIIPMRHNTPGNDATAPSMPMNVYAVAKSLLPSRVIGQGTRPSQQTGAGGKSVNKSAYAWGGSLPAGLAPKMKPGHKTDIYAGMKRFTTSSGGQKSSTYLTFRIMGEWSQGWIAPAKPGLYLARGVAEAIQPVAEKVIWQAVIKDAMN